MTGDDVHEATDTEDLLRLRRAGSTRHDQLTWFVLFDCAQHGAEGVWLGDASRIIPGCPGLIRFDRNAASGDKRLKWNVPESRRDRFIDLPTLRDDDVSHVRARNPWRS
jgi:hypothetical protein